MMMTMMTAIPNGAEVRQHFKNRNFQIQIQILKLHYRNSGEDIMSDEERRNCTYGSNKKLKPKTSILEATILSKSKLADLQPQQIVTQTVSSASTTLTNMSAGQLQLQRTSLPHTVAKGNIRSGIYATPKKLPKINPPKSRDQVRIIQRGSKMRSGVFKVN